MDVCPVIRCLFITKLKEVINQNHIRTGNTFFSRNTVIFLCQRMKIVPRTKLRMCLVLIIEELTGNGSKLNFITGSIDFFCEMNGIESIKFFEPVQMPPPAAEFSVCYIFQTVCHFLFYQ